MQNNRSASLVHDERVSPMKIKHPCVLAGFWQRTPFGSWHVLACRGSFAFYSRVWCGRSRFLFTSNWKESDHCNRQRFMTNEIWRRKKAPRPNDRFRFILNSEYQILADELLILVLYSPRQTNVDGESWDATTTTSTIHSIRRVRIGSLESQSKMIFFRSDQQRKINETTRTINKSTSTPFDSRLLSSY